MGEALQLQYNVPIDLYLCLLLAPSPGSSQTGAVGATGLQGIQGETGVPGPSSMRCSSSMSPSSRLTDLRSIRSHRPSWTGYDIRVRRLLDPGMLSYRLSSAATICLRQRCHQRRLQHYCDRNLFVGCSRSVRQCLLHQSWIELLWYCEHCFIDDDSGLLLWDADDFWDERFWELRLLQWSGQSGDLWEGWFGSCGICENDMMYMLNFGRAIAWALYVFRGNGASFGVPDSISHG